MNFNFMKQESFLRIWRSNSWPRNSLHFTENQVSLRARNCPWSLLRCRRTQSRHTVLLLTPLNSLSYNLRLDLPVNLFLSSSPVTILYTLFNCPTLTAYPASFTLFDLITTVILGVDYKLRRSTMHFSPEIFCLISVLHILRINRLYCLFPGLLLNIKVKWLLTSGQLCMMNMKTRHKIPSVLELKHSHLWVTYQYGYMSALGLTTYRRKIYHLRRVQKYDYVVVLCCDSV
jgi:hypothetical protein